MSHIPQRAEKDCLNCGTIVEGRYCQNCGQENVVPKETFWHMVTHFFYDITHFDSNFFHTVHHLVFKPGFLSMEYISGKRSSYLHPIRMYVFSSAIFFLLLFSVFKINPVVTDVNAPITLEKRQVYIEKLQKELQKDTSNTKIKSHLLLAMDTTQPITMKDMLATGEGRVGISLTDKNYASREEYDSLQRLLPEPERDGWLGRRLVRKQIEINNKYKDNPEQMLAAFSKSVLHRLPYMLFVSLPLFALILKLIYIRRKQFYFADHGIFTIHLYVFTFLLLMMAFALDEIQGLTNWDILDTVQGFMFLGLFVYLLLAMKRFYRQRWWKTILKFLLVSIFSLVMMLILLVAFMFFSAVTF